MTRREGWLWAAAAAYFGVILATLTVVQGLLLRSAQAGAWKAVRQMLQVRG